jgi:DNA-binding CsgD family transcriptional regulator
VDEAGQPLVEAHEQLAGMGAEIERRTVGDVLGALGIRPRPGDGGGGRREAAVSTDPLGGLTAREREIARLAATGASSRAMALRLSLSERTVENHLQHVYAKLGLHSRAELIALVAGTLTAPV